MFIIMIALVTQLCSRSNLKNIFAILSRSLWERYFKKLLLANVTAHALTFLLFKFFLTLMHKKIAGIIF